MTNKASLLLALVLALPATAAAQTAPPAPATVTPPAGVAPAVPRDHVWSDADRATMQADMAKMQAEMAKVQAAHAQTRAKILAALTPAHKKFFAGLIASLAVAANPDWKAATAKLDATLSATEKSNILAIHDAAMKQMMDAMPHMMGPMPAMRMRMRAPDGSMPRMKMQCQTIKSSTTTTDGTTTITTTCTRNATGGTPDVSAPMAPMPPMVDAPPAPGSSQPGQRRIYVIDRDGPAPMAFGMGHRSEGPLTAGGILMHLAGPATGAPMQFRFRTERTKSSTSTSTSQP